MKTEAYNQDDVAKVLQIRANIEGLKLGPDVLDRLAAEGARSSLRFVALPPRFYKYGNLGLQVRLATLDTRINTRGDCRTVDYRG